MTLARFTPSVLDGATLEQLFVHRHHLLDDVLARITEAATGTGRRHRLFVGQRGAGKTHLISLVHHRARQAQADGLPIVLSWLMEDPWEIETYDDLLAQILEQAGEPVPPRGAAERELLTLAADRLVVVLIENLDQILTEIGADGQRRLRALLENERPMLLIATSTRLSDDLLSQAEPFYGFFDTTQLEPFTVDQAADMLTEVAHHAGDGALAALLATPTGRARLATIAHLAGGQPRVWALLGTGLTDSGIDDMVDMLLARFDDLTPYYQEQLARLSPNERKVVRRIADADRPMTVGDIAEAARLDQRSVSKTISDLRKRGWVRKHESILTKGLDARRSYYELAEPLARIAFQMKAARGEPVRLVVDFLSTWFQDDQLSDATGHRTGDTYRDAAIAMRTAEVLAAHALQGRDYPALRSSEILPVLDNLASALRSFAEHGNATALLQLPASISQLMEARSQDVGTTEIILEVCRLAVKCGGRKEWKAHIDWVLPHLSGSREALALLLLAVLEAVDPNPVEAFSALLGEFNRSISEISKSATDQLASDAWRIALTSWRAEILIERLLSLPNFSDVSVPTRLEGVFALAMLRLGRGEGKEALTMMSKAVEAIPAGQPLWEAHYYISRLCLIVGDVGGSLTAVDAAIGDMSSLVEPWSSPVVRLRCDRARIVNTMNPGAALAELSALESVGAEWSDERRAEIVKLATELRSPT